MKPFRLLHTLCANTVVLLVLFLAGCAKQEQPLAEPEFAGLFLQAVTVDPMRLRVMDGEQQLTNALISTGRSVTASVTYYDKVHRVRVFDFYGDVLLLDTLVAYERTPFYLTFYQDRAGDKLRWIGPPVGEATLASGTLKISIVYTAPALPASLKVVVENMVTAGGTQYEPTDSFVLDKSTFSKYFVGVNHEERKPRLRMYTTGAERKLIANVAPEQFLSTNFDFSTFLFDRASGGGVFNLESKKLY